MSEFDQMYREVILDHYKTPRNHGLLEPHDAVAEGPEPALRRRGDGLGAIRPPTT
jgi:NifU-like protein involved in Fe-S cluster formation